jgi:hypothetical protein
MPLFMQHELMGRLRREALPAMLRVLCFGPAKAGGMK